MNIPKLFLFSGHKHIIVDNVNILLYLLVYISNNY